jgi:hypothetical protein
MHDINSFLLAQTSTAKGFEVGDLLKPDGLVVQLVFAIAILVGGYVIAIFFASMSVHDRKLAKTYKY